MYDLYVTYGYNANNQMVTVTDWNNRITTYEYDNNGRLIKESRPNGTYQTYTYNNAGQLISTIDQKLDGSIINKYDYEYDADGNIITEDSINEPNYDNITIPSSDMNYGKANQLTTFNGTLINYNKDGNMLNTPLKDKWSVLTYNSQNLLTDVTSTDGAITIYGYDVENNRICKTENGITTNYVVNPNAELSQVLISEKNEEITYYIYGLGLIAQENSEGYKTYHYDYRGSTTAITNEKGVVTDRVYYDVYGNILSQTGTTYTPYLYVGRSGVETDENGLYYMRARYYNPTIQRFINIDPIKNGYNWYGYTSGNPINSIDPTGYFDWTSGEQWKQLGNGVWDKMCDYSDYVWDGNKVFWSDPVGNLAILKDYAIQETRKTWDSGVNVIQAHMRGDINLFDIGVKYYNDQLIGVYNTLKSAENGLWQGLWQLSPFSTLSNDEVYQLGYNLEGALLSTSEIIVTLYVCIETPGVANQISAKVSSKLKPVNKKITSNNIKTDFYVTPNGTVIPAKNAKLYSEYDRPVMEIKSGRAMFSQNVMDDWDNFLGLNQTDIDPFSGKKSIDRIWSQDGKRSIRFGNHEMDGMNTKNFHYHRETWYNDYVLNELQRIQIK